MLGFGQETPFFLLCQLISPQAQESRGKAGMLEGQSFLLWSGSCSTTQVPSTIPQDLVSGASPILEALPP